MSQSDAPNAEAAKGTDKWAKAVVDGLPSDPDSDEPAAGSDADSTAPDDSWWVEEPDESATDDPQAAAEPPKKPSRKGPPPIDPQAVENAADPEDGADPEDAADVVDVDESEGVPADGATAAPDAADGDSPAVDISVEDLVIDLERVTTERDQYLDASRRLQAEFENYKKQVVKREAEARERANDSLIGELLPVLDAFDGAMANGAEDVAPMRATFLEAMAKQGLERIDPADAPFDPTLHEAVMHEDASDTDGPVVAEVMRAGYVWKGRVLRPAMVRTRG